MKTKLLYFIAIPLVALFVVSCEHGKSNRVVVTKDSIVLSGVDLSKSDTERINAILQRYDTKLFKFEEYENGQIKTAMGDLSEDELIKKFKAAKMKRLGETGFSHYSGVLYCCGGNPNVHPTPTPSVTASASAETSQTDPEFLELKSILEKYR
jgi:hypothetical protein